MVRVVVLLGPPGSGKSTIGRALGARGLRWRDWEPVIVERWGSREDFIARKAEALPALHREILDWIAAEPAPAVVETTGLSDAPLLARLAGSGDAFVVRLDVPEATALRRVAERAQGEHLTDDPDLSRGVWRAYDEHVAPTYPADLVVDTATVAVVSAAAAILGAMAAGGR